MPRYTVQRHRNPEDNMLYRLNTTDCRYDRLDPLPFKDFAHFGKREKEMEHLIAGSILDVLFEDASLMPIFLLVFSLN
jgi:hypothetical protein